MWNKSRVLAVALALLIVAGGGLVWWMNLPLRELTRGELDLRQGVLYAHGETKPFRGLLVERYPSKVRKLSIEISEGHPAGKSEGWFENGRKEIEEHFTRGVSDGLRTRWFSDGKKRSTVMIVQGRFTGLYEEWHPNGRKAFEITYRDGKPDGATRCWSESGAEKPGLVYRNGVVQTAAR